MPVFFFDYFDGEALTADHDGTELPDIQAARDEAAETLLSIGKETLPSGGEEKSLGVRVRNSDGQHLLTISLHYSEQPPTWVR